MSDEIAIRIEGLGKRYRLGETVDLARNLRETLSSLPHLLGRRLFTKRGGGRLADEEGNTPAEFWALRDIDLEVRRGEVVGLIGSNGAGKSTLLKILSRITSPTTGVAEIRGQVGSLLEVGTGMHAELTGRENIFLSGAILGMRKAHIKRHFDEIVAFAGVERFLSTPVKRYSSGMQVRLAFAVAAHLETDILIVDEVLAVGDAEFRRKCLGKMEKVAGGGRTVLFVSHNMQAVEGLCDRAVLLQEGRIVARGDTPTIVQTYLDHTQRKSPNLQITPAMHRVFPPALEIHHVELLNAADEPTVHVVMGQHFTVQMRYRVHEPDRTYAVSASIRTQNGLLLTTSSNQDPIESLPANSEADYVMAVQMENVLSSGDYFLEIKVEAARTLVDVIKNLPLRVVNAALSE